MVHATVLQPANAGAVIAMECRGMTRRQLEIIRALERVTFPIATSQKRFAMNMIALARSSPERELTEKQAKYLTILAWRFRRQMPAHLAYPELDEEQIVDRTDASPNSTSA